MTNFNSVCARKNLAMALSVLFFQERLILNFGVTQHKAMCLSTQYVYISRKVSKSFTLS